MIELGDIREGSLQGIAADSIDACITDPPYELGFMGKAWDRSGVAIDPEAWREVYRVLKPGAHLAAFGGSRTFHRIAVAIEDAGFEIRDSLSWLYGSGFPKSLNVSKAIDKADGRQGAVTPNTGKWKGGQSFGGGMAMYAKDGESTVIVDYKPASPEAEQWEGWGTALKPAWEPIILARKPLAEKTVAANVLEYGTGAINIDGCRIGEELLSAHGGGITGDRIYGGGVGVPAQDRGSNPHTGRWPANVCLDEEAGAMLDAQSGERKDVFRRSKGSAPAGNGNTHGVMQEIDHQRGYGDSGGASRFFYCAKASQAERNAGLAEKNAHPTVKPLNLMRWLCRLLCPVGGIIVDPFVGSGTTGIAAALERMQFEGRDKDAAYVDIARDRIAYWSKVLQPKLW